MAIKSHVDLLEHKIQEQAQRIAELEAERDKWKEAHDLLLKDYRYFIAELRQMLKDGKSPKTVIRRVDGVLEEAPDDRT